MDLSLHLSLAPNITESIKHRRLVASNAPDKTAQFRHSTIKLLFDPGF